MGEVYEAWDPELKDRIALKTIRPYIANDPMIIQRFKREVKQARGISHANVCRVYDLVCHQQASGEQIWFLAMELLEGQTLLEPHSRARPLKNLAGSEADRANRCRPCRGPRAWHHYIAISRAAT